MFNTKDMMTEMYKEFPEIEEKYIDKICKVGMMGILKLARSSEEVIITTAGKKEVKFCYQNKPEEQFKLTKSNVRKRARMAARKKQNGEASK